MLDAHKPNTLSACSRVVSFRSSGNCLPGEGPSFFVELAPSRCGSRKRRLRQLTRHARLPRGLRQLAGVGGQDTQDVELSVVPGGQDHGHELGGEFGHVGGALVERGFERTALEIARRVPGARPWRIRWRPRASAQRRYSAIRRAIRGETPAGAATAHRPRRNERRGLNRAGMARRLMRSFTSIMWGTPTGKLEPGSIASTLRCRSGVIRLRWRDASCRSCRKPLREVPQNPSAQW